MAATYDGSSKPAGVTFYVDGVKNDGFSFNFADLPKQPRALTLDITTLSPYCLGGRNRKSEKDGPSAGGCNYAMIGDIDEAGVFAYALPPGCVIAIHSLATELKYPLGQVNQLIDLHRAGKGEVKIGDRTWVCTGDLKDALGKCVKDGNKLSVRLADDATGVRTK